VEKERRIFQKWEQNTHMQFLQYENLMFTKKILSYQYYYKGVVIMLRTFSQLPGKIT